MLRAGSEGTGDRVGHLTAGKQRIIVVVGAPDDEQLLSDRVPSHRPAGFARSARCGRHRRRSPEAARSPGKCGRSWRIGRAVSTRPAERRSADGAMSLIDVKGDRRTSAAGGCATASSAATAVPSDSPKYTSRRRSTSARVRMYSTRCARIFPESFFAWRTRISSKAAIVEQQNGQIRSCQHISKRCAKRAIARIAVEHDHREFAASQSVLTNQPFSVSPSSVGNDTADTPAIADDSGLGTCADGKYMSLRCWDHTSASSDTKTTAATSATLTLRSLSNLINWRDGHP